ncbi:TPR-like protein [Nadsonia fulvescens var. elongata DSM 6958]|uniref:TPR-like protein n=1 Tax=Nadsonia fulvescens var. elongata DSM 6958 TaxID=857566 RepID=A0A1E3PI94_9ASCO|nr:TPR-like protein [Nadsonia fulvescens var. elongata DSM 6958]
MSDSAANFTYDPDQNGLGSAEDKSGNILDIPTGEEGEVVQLDLDNDLPEDPNDLCVFLENEKCDVQYWLAIGLAYSRKNLIDEGLEVIKRGMEVLREGDIMPFEACISWLYLKKVRSAPVEPIKGPNDQPLQTKGDYHKLATTYVNNATTKVSNWYINHLARGVTSIVTGKFDDALAPFDKVIKESGNSNILATMGKARVLYAKKNYKGALKLYQSALAARPDMFPDPRIGIGLCFWKLDAKHDALAAWERALEINPENEATNTYLSLYYMDKALSDVESQDFAQLYAKSLGYTQAVFKRNKTNPAAAISLATYLFSKKNTPAVLKLCETVINYSNVPTLISEGYFWMARSYHHMEDYTKAERYYNMAESSDKTSILAKMGKGYVQVANNDSASAILTFENMVHDNPNNPEALIMLGLLCSDPTIPGYTSERKRKSVIHLEKFIRLSKDKNEPVPIEVFVTIAKIKQGTDNNGALTALENALSTLKDNDKAASIELQNNIGVLHYTMGSLDSARTYFEMALEECEKQKSETESSESSEKKRIEAEFLVSVTYNIARLEEAAGSADKARSLYHKVNELAPGYIDARIRLAYMDVAQALPDAFEGMQKLLDQNIDSLEVRSLFAWSLRRYKRASKNISDDAEQKHHKRTLVDYNKHDIYALISIGNLYLTIAREIRASSNSDVEKKDKSYVKASEFFAKALQLDPKNAFAAQGIAIILSETKRAEMALSIFIKIRETLHDVSVYMNLGHCQVELKQYSKAIESYEIALNRFKGGSDPQLLTLLGRAWYARGVSESSLESLKTSLAYSKSAVELIPDNPSLKFNVAFMQFQISDVVRRLPETRRTAEDIKFAADGLEQAIVLLNEIAKDKRPPYPANELEQRALMGQNTVRKQLERALEDQEEYESLAASKLDAARKIRDAEKAKLEAERKFKEEEERKRQEIMAEERRVLQEQAREWSDRARMDLEKREEEEAEKRSKKKSNGPKRSKKQREGSDASSDEGISSGVSSDEESAKDSDSDNELKTTSKRSKNKSTGETEPSKKKRRLVKKQSDLSNERIQDSDEEEPLPSEAGDKIQQSEVVAHEADTADPDLFGDDSE